MNTPIFHQILYSINYIRIHGASLNFDGSRDGNYGKLKIKDNIKLTRKEKVLFNFNIDRRITEDDVVDIASNIFMYNRCYCPFEFCSDNDIA